MNTKSRIIKAATAVIFSRGYHEARLDEIAGRAGITTPAIYKHFKNKEDLLFTITLVNSLQFMKKLEQDLQGVQGPANLIRKIIWTYLDSYQRNPQEAIILLMECRSNNRYYQTEPYQIVKRLNRHFVDIIDDGKRIGEFDSSVNTSIVRDLTFGTMDFSVLSCLVLKEIQSITEDFAGLIKLFQNMTRPKPTGESEQKN